MDLKIKGENKLEFIIKILIYSMFYGLIMINYIDLISPGAYGYHLWLISMYFAPFIPVLFILGFDDWELLISMGLIASLMNDLFYYPIGIILFHREVDLIEWYLWQLGFRGLDARWIFQGGIFTFPVTSILMGFSIYFRIAITTLILWKWWREE